MSERGRGDPNRPACGSLRRRLHRRRPADPVLTTERLGPVGTPFDILASYATPRTTSKASLVSRCRELEAEALSDPPISASVTLQDQRHLTRATLRVYVALAHEGTSVTMLGRGLTAWLGPGVTGVALPDDDPLVDVWSLAFVSATRPVALAARDLHAEEMADAERLFAVVLTRDREAVAASVGALGLPPASGGAGAGWPPA